MIKETTNLARKSCNLLIYNEGPRKAGQPQGEHAPPHSLSLWSQKFMASGVSERSVYEGITAYSPRHFLNWLSWSQVFPRKIATFVRHAVNVSYSFWSQVGLYGSSPVSLLIHTLSIGRVAGNMPIGLVTHGSKVHQPCKQDFRSSPNLGASMKAMSTRLFSLSLGSRVNAFLVIMRVITGRWCLQAEIECHFQYSFSLRLRDNQLCS